MSTILDALRKLQRERSAQSPAHDLRGSVTTETPATRQRRRRVGSRWLSLSLLILILGGAGYALYRSGQLDALLANSSDEERIPTDAELDEVERETLAREVASRADSAPSAEDTSPAAPIAPGPRAKLARPAGPEVPATTEAPGVRADSPEVAAERARLEAALVNARAAQEAQRQAVVDAAAQEQRAASNPQPPAPAPAALPKPARAQRETPVPVVAAKAEASKPAATPKTETRSEAPRAREPREEVAPSPSAFPEVEVVSIRWHPIAERRVANLRFERQNAPEAREGDIIAGVLVYRIDPGAVELHVGSAKRSFSPGP